MLKLFPPLTLKADIAYKKIQMEKQACKEKTCNKLAAYVWTPFN